MWNMSGMNSAMMQGMAGPPMNSGVSPFMISGGSFATPVVSAQVQDPSPGPSKPAKPDPFAALFSFSEGVPATPAKPSSPMIASLPSPRSTQTASTGGEFNPFGQSQHQPQQSSADFNPFF